MDVQMPEMDGLTATATIRATEHTAGGPRIPIVAMTANAMPGDREICLQAGMDDYLTKPVKIDALRAALEQWLPTGVMSVVL
jgi:CheY-like chemotaxis protein